MADVEVKAGVETTKTAVDALRWLAEEGKEGQGTSVWETLSRSVVNEMIDRYVAVSGVRGISKVERAALQDFLHHAIRGHF